MFADVIKIFEREVSKVYYDKSAVDYPNSKDVPVVDDKCAEKSLPDTSDSYPDSLKDSAIDEIAKSSRDSVCVAKAEEWCDVTPSGEYTNIIEDCVASYMVSCCFKD